MLLWATGHCFVTQEQTERTVEDPVGSYRVQRQRGPVSYVRTEAEAPLEKPQGETW